jgi:hypothetical protein
MTIAKKPRCKNCRKRPASRKVWGYFCTLRCAAQYGASVFGCDFPYWCPECEWWYPAGDLCPHRSPED